jgi:hypothetical protein
MAKIAPYLAGTGTNRLLIHGGRSRMLRQVTLTYFIAVPLGGIAPCNALNLNCFQINICLILIEINT